MTEVRSEQRPRRWTFVAALTVSLLFLASNVSTLLARIEGMAASADINKKISQASLFGSVVFGDLVWFFLAIAGLHIAVAFAGYAGTRVAVRSVGRLQRMPEPLLAAAATTLLFAWIYAANAAAFPWSTSGGEFSALARAQIGGLSLFAVLTVVCAGLAGWLGLRALKSSRAYSYAGPRLLVYPAVLLALFGAWRITSLANAHDGDIPVRPHVILIGVDSLRPDAVAMKRSVGLTPNIDRFISESVHFEDAITPLARTFPSWITMLTGRHPVVTRVRENLLSPEDLNIPPTLAQVLQKNGYRTVYATDDVRSSNIDQRYGFDDIVGPRIGALDFLLGTINDLPLPNLVANTWLGELLFPYNYINRASSVTYELDTFVDEVGSRVDFEQPTMLAVHLTLPHYPYYWASDTKGSLAEALRQPYLYSNSVIGADQQVGMLLEMLERKGALNNAIVVLLSDHGEGLGLPGDNLLAGREAKAAARGVTVQMWGHGNSTLSPGQYRVVFSWKGFGKSDALVGQGSIDTPASLEDLMPTMLDLIGIPFDGEFDGLSLREEIVAGDTASDRLSDRVRYTETGITMGFTKLGDAKVDEIVQQGMLAYAINPDNGRLELRREYFDELMRSKERAAIGKTRVLAAVPLPDGSTRYVALPLDGGGLPKFLDGPPSAVDDPELARLWQGLGDRFRSELVPLDRS